MLDTQYASANTLIRIKEKEFLTREQLEQLVRVDSLSQALSQLKNTVYSNLSDDFDQDLLQHQIMMYKELSELIDDVNVKNVFTLIYVYHNLKVLIKQQLTGLQLEHLLIPIGEYSIDELKQLVQTLESDMLPLNVVDCVRYVVENYQHYENVQSIDLLLDEGYFKHILVCVNQLNDEKLLNTVKFWIDIFNVTTVLRLSKGKLSRSQLKLFLVEGGHLQVSELIDLAMVNKLKDVVALLNTTPFNFVINLLGVSNESPVGDIERLKDNVTHYYLQDAKYEAFGYLPLLSFVFYKEMEIKNLRLILTGKDNQMDSALLKERMKPVYVV